MKPSFDKKPDGEVYIPVNFGYWPGTFMRLVSGNEERGRINGEHMVSGGTLVVGSW